MGSRLAVAWAVQVRANLELELVRYGEDGHAQRRAALVQVALHLPQWQAHGRMTKARRLARRVLTVTEEARLYPSIATRRPLTLFVLSSKPEEINDILWALFNAWPVHGRPTQVPCLCMLPVNTSDSGLEPCFSPASDVLLQSWL